MRPYAGPALLLLAVAAGGCDSDQPALVSSQTATLDFLAGGASTTEFRTWVMFEDNDQNLIADDIDGDGQGDPFMWCESSGGTMSTASAPWPFTVTIKVLRPGQSVPEVIAQDLSNGPARARYDGLLGVPASSFSHIQAINPANQGLYVRSHRRGRCSLDPDIVCNPDVTTSTLCADFGAGTCFPFGTCSLDPSQTCSPGAPNEMSCEKQGLGSCDVEMVTRRFQFLNDVTRLRRSAANEELLLAPDNLLFQVDPSFAQTVVSDAIGAQPSGGVCPGTYLGPSQVDGNLLPMQIEIEKGSTLIVEAKRLPQAPGGNIPFTGLPGLLARFSVDGALPSVNGNVAAGPGEDEFIQFFFQSQ